jgi:arsenate reductase
MEESMSDRKNVLFVCVHNAGRSQMAEAFFNHLTVTTSMAQSAGTLPSDTVHQNVIDVMREVGISLESARPKILTEYMIEQADKVFTMGCSVTDACPNVLVVSEDWGIEDPSGKPIETIRHIRDEIRDKVKKLLTL